MLQIVKQRAYPGTQAVRRAVALLKAVGRDGQPGLGDLVRVVGLNKTTAYRLLTALESEGLIERAPEGERYRLGPELLALGARARGGVDLLGASRTELAALAHETRETATLEVLAGTETLILDEAMGGHVIGSRPSVGTRWPAHATSTGKALLAHLSDEERDALLQQPLRRVTPRTLGERGALARELQRVRERGYAISAEELEPGYVAVGAPIHDATGRAVAAISLGGPKGRVTQEQQRRFARLLTAAAARVSERLGHTPAKEPVKTVKRLGGRTKR